MERMERRELRGDDRHLTLTHAQLSKHGLLQIDSQPASQTDRQTVRRSDSLSLRQTGSFMQSEAGSRTPAVNQAGRVTARGQRPCSDVSAAPTPIAHLACGE